MYNNRFTFFDTRNKNSTTDNIKKNNKKIVAML